MNRYIEHGIPRSSYKYLPFIYVYIQSILYSAFRTLCFFYTMREVASALSSLCVSCPLPRLLIAAENIDGHASFLLVFLHFFVGLFKPPVPFKFRGEEDLCRFFRRTSVIVAVIWFFLTQHTSKPLKPTTIHLNPQTQPQYS